MLSKAYLLVASAMLLLGVSAGAFLGWKSTPSHEPEQSSVQGFASPPPIPQGENPLLFSPFKKGEKSIGEGEGMYQTPKPKTPSTSSGPTACQQAKKDLDAAKAEAQKVYDQEQTSISRQLTELSRQRNEAINNYLTAIAIATSKYNSSTSTDAYAIYQQEQSRTLNDYTQATTNILNQEAPLLDAKKASQAKYDEALAATSGCNP